MLHWRKFVPLTLLSLLHFHDQFVIISFPSFTDQVFVLDRVGSTLQPITIACFDKYGNQIPIVSPPEIRVILKLRGSHVQIDKVKTRLSSDKLMLEVMVCYNGSHMQIHHVMLHSVCNKKCIVQIRALFYIFQFCRIYLLKALSWIKYGQAMKRFCWFSYKMSRIHFQFHVKVFMLIK